MSFTILRRTFNYDFIKLCRYAYILSFLLFVISIIAIFVRGGIPLGVDFQGGAFIQFAMESPVSAQEVRSALEKTAIKDIVIQSIGSENKEYSVRFANEDIEGSATEIVLRSLQEAFPDIPVTIELSETVGSKVSSDIRDKALEGLYYALLIIAIYISGRFEDKWGVPIVITLALFLLFILFAKFSIPLLYATPLLLIVTIALFIFGRLAFALGTIFSLLHDVLLTSGLLIVCGISFDLSIIAGLLAILGYSLNDTIIVYDRIREYVKNEEVVDVSQLRSVINKSITSTLSRTILTSITTLLVLLSLLFLGGNLLFPFALTITIGICIGTLSSIFIASPILLLFGIKKEDKTPIIIDHNGVV